MYESIFGLFQQHRPFLLRSTDHQRILLSIEKNGLMRSHLVHTILHWIETNPPKTSKPKTWRTLDPQPVRCPSSAQHAAPGGFHSCCSCSDSVRTHSTTAVAAPTTWPLPRQYLGGGSVSQEWGNNRKRFPPGRGCTPPKLTWNLGMDLLEDYFPLTPSVFEVPC